ncbi:hypothetical protein [Rathayibacter tritici]|uniref:hypothetical protein n=1 Tax=Rathayibacter tritici TaxID=33888 RepID=UPI00142F2C50|nr:hypothetical protein [Rathayibacter tritici]
MIPITSRVKPEPRTPAIHADEGGAGGCFGRGAREGRGARGAEAVRGFPAAVVLPAGRAAAAGSVRAAGAGAGRRGALPGAEGRRG